MASGKILLFAANPIESVRLELDKEARDIEQKLRSAHHRDFFSLRTRWAVTAHLCPAKPERTLPRVVISRPCNGCQASEPPWPDRHASPQTTCCRPCSRTRPVWTSRGALCVS
jgi:hypothetical protein